MGPSNSSNPARGRTLAPAAGIIFAAAFLMNVGALAYDRYSVDKDATNCRSCHGDFRDSIYDELAADGLSWPDGLHDTHRNTMLDGDCGTCHGSGPRFPVLIDSSEGGTGLAPISCVGCHGRLEDAFDGTKGAGAGLRQQHWRAGETVCQDCHDDSDPLNFLPAGEETLPPYYADPGIDHPEMPRDPCDPAALLRFEDYAGSAKGLDNDGDALYDAADPDCGLVAVCGNGIVETGEDCDDGNTAAGDCCSPVCVFEVIGSPCDDSVGCTVLDTCDGVGVCTGTPSDALCDDLEFCTGVETCDPILDCQSGVPVNCDDGVGCTVDSCDEQTDACANAPDDALCDNGQFCDGVETCDPVQDCQPGTEVDCDDGVVCTVDSCDEPSDACANVADDAACDNGQFCDGAETCDPVQDCQPGSPVDCDDGEICTDDSCNEVTDSCDNIFDPTNDPQCEIPECGNGFVETGEECDDGNTAAGDCCSPTCAFEAVDSPCDDGVGCTVPDICDGAGTCAGTPSDALCDDLEFCTGMETCEPVTGCQPGIPVDCDDGVGCTVDGCDESSDACVNVPDDAACSNGQFCDGPEVCDAAQDCQPGTPVDCDDGVGCTVDSCDEQNDACANVADDAPCSNGQFCDGVEICDPAQGCRSGPPVDCDDGEICTTDSCIENTDSCENVFDPDNAPECQTLCPDDDSDGFSDAGGICGAVDCNDSDPTVNPGATEQCDDDKDNDCDQLVDAADDACGFDGEWTVRQGPLSDTAYAGSTACMDCHSDHFERWRDSLHARILIRPGDAQAVGFPLPPHDPAGGVEVQSWSDVLFVIGQKWKTQLVDRNGLLQGVQWNYLRGQWDVLHDGELRPYDCGACHSTGFDQSAEFLDDQGLPVPGIEGSWVEFNVGCEACHGPGAVHVDDPSPDNINQLFFDWYDPDNDGAPDPVNVRSAVLCGNCHYRNDRQQIQTDRKSQEQFNDWLVSGHASTVKPDFNDPVDFASVNTYCAKCHSPGNAEYFASEHNFTYYEPADATHVACISCHDPHANSQPRWASLEFPSGGERDPRDHPAAIARYRGTDEDPSTRDFESFDSQETNSLCGDCHRQMPGFRRHKDARAPEEIVLQPPADPFLPDSPTVPFTVPHRAHVELDYADCVDCHMTYSRQSINRWDVRTHTFLPNEWAVDESTILFTLPHFDDTCGQCHAPALDCDWCHTGFGGRYKTPLRRDPRTRISRPRGYTNPNP